MKIKKNTGLKVAVDEWDERPSFSRKTFVMNVLLSSLGILSPMGIWFYSFNLTVNLWILIPFTGSMVVLYLYGVEKKNPWLSFLPLIFALGLLFFTYKQTIDGFYTLVNGFRESLSYTYLKVILPFDTTGEPLIFFQLVLVSLMTMPMTLGIKRKKTAIPLGLGFGFLLFFFLIRVDFHDFSMILFSAFLVMVVLRKNFEEKGSLKVMTYLLILGMFCLSFMLGLDIKGSSEFVKGHLDEARSKMISTMDTLYYGKKSVLPEGDFNGLAAFKPKEEPVLEIIMDKPDSLYLKGFVGSRFQENRWENLTRETLFAQRDLFYWLNEEEFHGEAQLALLENTLAPEASSHQMTIRRTSSRKKGVYTPYEVVYEKEREKRSREISDVSLSFLQKGERGPVQFQVMPNEVKRYTTLGRDLERGKKENNSLVMDYLKKESHYNKFVYDAYLELDAGDETLLKNLLGEYDLKEGIHLPYDKVKEKILRSLYDLVYYNEEAVFPKGQGSFLQSFLETQQEGYSVHYATAATLMFRYYGIPARYVEGVLVTPEDVEGVLSNAIISLDDTHSHAWTEFYQDGVGWIPFETTPPYLNIMEKADALERLPEDVNSNKEPPPEVEKPLTDEDTVRQGLTELILIQLKELLGYLIIGFALFLLMLALVKTGLMFKRRSQFKHDFLALESKVKKEQALGLFSHLLRLLIYFQRVENVNQVYEYQGKIPGLNEDASMVEAAFLIAQKAKYSGAEITTDQVNQVRKAYDKVLQRVKEKTTIKESFKHRFIDIVYL